jgi:hypothetical protein
LSPFILDVELVAHFTVEFNFQVFFGRYPRANAHRVGLSPICFALARSHTGSIPSARAAPAANTALIYKLLDKKQQQQ